MRNGRMGWGAWAFALAIGGGVPAAQAQNATAPDAPADRPGGTPRSGVITPPATIDPGLRKTPPSTGTTGTVIAPPGTAGNQPELVPK